MSDPPRIDPAAALAQARDLSPENAAVAIARETEDRYRALVEGLPDGVTVQIGDRIVFANHSIARILRMPESTELIGHSISEFPALAGLQAAIDAAGRGDPEGPLASRECEVTRSDGSTALLELQCRRVTFAEQPAVQCLIRDVTESRRAQRLQAALYRIADASARALNLGDLLESVHSAVGELMDARNFFIALKDETGRNFLFPYFRDEKTEAVESLPIRASFSAQVLAEGRPLLLDGEGLAALRAQGLPTFGPPAVSGIGVPLILREVSFGVLVVQSYRDNVRYTESDRDLLSYVSHHIAEAIDRQRKEDQIEYLAFHDGLTGLPNRLLFEDRLTRALAQAARRGAPLSVLFIDLDRLKVINDSLGHPAGDEVLTTVAERLARGVRDGDSIARRGGDEFLVLLPDTPAEGAIEVAQKLIESLRPPMRCAGRDVSVTASLGIATYPENGEKGEALLQAADIAMYRAKQQGGGVHQRFDPVMNTVAQRRLTVETKLRRSLASGQIGPHFQPILNGETGRVVGAEALLRWSPLLSDTMPPKEFIPVAEQTGLIVSLGAFVLREALRHAKEWPITRELPMRLSINVAARQIHDPSCVGLILEALRQADFPAERLQLELSESTQITEDAAAVDRLRALRSEGVSIAIDDFGVGYSSLSRLRHLPFDTLKIDGTFIKDMAIDARSDEIAGAVITLGRNLGLEVVAEGVETEAQKDRLLARGCRLMQGFLFAGAMPPGVFAAWVSQRE